MLWDDDCWIPNLNLCVYIQLIPWCLHGIEAPKRSWTFLINVNARAIKRQNLLWAAAPFNHFVTLRLHKQKEDSNNDKRKWAAHGSRCLPINQFRTPLLATHTWPLAHYTVLKTLNTKHCCVRKWSNRHRERRYNLMLGELLAWWWWGGEGLL